MKLIKTMKIVIVLLTLLGYITNRGDPPQGIDKLYWDGYGEATESRMLSSLEELKGAVQKSQLKKLGKVTYENGSDKIAVDFEISKNHQQNSNLIDSNSEKAKTDLQNRVAKMLYTISEYSGKMNENLNWYLRLNLYNKNKNQGDDLPFGYKLMNQYTSLIDEYINNEKVNGIYYRGQTINNLVFEKSIIKNMSFLSTSMGKFVAINKFMNPQRQQSTLLVFLTTGSTSGRFAKHVEEHLDEREVLLGREQLWYSVLVEEHSMKDIKAEIDALTEKALSKMKELKISNFIFKDM